MLNNATGTAEIAAASMNGSMVTGLANTDGIIPFMAPSAIATVTPGLLTRHDTACSADFLGWDDFLNIYIVVCLYIKRFLYWFLIGYVTYM